MKKAFNTNKVGPLDAEEVLPLSPTCAKSHCACEHCETTHIVIHEGPSEEEIEKEVERRVKKRLDITEDEDKNKK